MLTVKKSDTRGKGDHGWLKSQFSFSFADYYDPAQMGFRALRVINEDHIEGGKGFPMHPHRDMEIITYLVSGALAHKDSHGNSSTILPGEVQRMSAGTGVAHSEFNPRANEEAHLLQIWILPDKTGHKFSYGQKSFEKELGEKKLVLTVSGNGRDGSIPIQQDADLYVSRPKRGDKIAFELRPGRHAWLQVVKGGLKVNGHELEAGDAIYGSEEKLLQIDSEDGGEFLLFDLA
jgi:redox-sensitive bicupin YhaK (pirin superfamily)